MKVVSKNTRKGLIPNLIIFYYALAPFLYLLRTLAGDSGSVAVALRSSEPLLFISTVSACALQQRFKFNAFSLLFFLLGLYGFFLGVLQQNNLSDLLGGYLHFLAGLILFIYFNYHDFSQETRFMNSLSYIMLISYGLVIVLIYSLPWVLGIHIYLGLACQILIVVFFYNFHNRRFLISALALLLILLSGKRGVVVATVIAVMGSFLFTLGHLQLGKIMKGSCAALALAVILISVFPSTTEQVFNKYLFKENSSVDDYSAGRWNEVLSAFHDWQEDYSKIILGSGFGFTYTYYHAGSKIPDIEAYKNVHFSYLNPLVIFGLPVSIIYYTALGFLFLRIFTMATPFKYMQWSCFGYLIYACFVFDLFDEPILWMMAGVLYREKKRFLVRWDLAQQ